MTHSILNFRRTASLAQRIEQFSLLLFATFILILGGSSWLISSEEHARTYSQLLDKEMEFQVAHVSTRIQSIYEALKRAAQSSLISTALVDSAGKDAYLVPYLQGLNRVEGIPVSLVFVNFEGEEIASNGNTSFTDVQLAWLRKLLANHSMAPATIMGTGESAELVIAERIYYSRTRMPEGALMYKLKIGDLMDPKAPLHWAGDGFVPSKAAAWQPLKVPHALQPLNLSLILKDTLVAPSSLSKWLFIYFFAILAAIAFVSWLSRWIANKLTGDLQRLSDFAGQVVLTEFGNMRANLGETREVIQLANAINSMLDRLDSQHRKLQEESEAKFRNLVENIPGAAYRWLLPDKGCMDYLSHGIQELTGHPVSDFINDKIQSYSDIIEPDDRGIRQVSDDHAAHIWEYRIRHANGELRWIWERNRVCRDMHGKAVYLDGVLVDVTERKNAEQVLIEARQMADSANLAKSQFLATMSHELRTPMNGIVGMAELLMQPNLINNTRVKFAKIIFDSSRTLLGLLNDILDFSRIEAGQMELKKSPLKPKKIVTEIVSFFTAATQNKNLKIETAFDICCELEYLGDSVRMRQMLSNLVGNAVKFTDHGSILIEVNEISRDKDNAVLKFSVTDTGIGITKKDLHLLFQPFSQLDNSNARKYSGSGLGLSITRHLATMMGGELGAESELGRGSRFWFRVPLCLSAENPPEPPGMSYCPANK